MAFAPLQVSAWSARGVRCANKSKSYGSRLLRCRRRWSGPKVCRVRCSTNCPKDVASRSLRHAAGAAALTAGIRDGGCASASHLGSRRLRTRRWRLLTVLWPRVALLSSARMPWRTSRSALGCAAAASGTLSSSSASSRERASREAAWQDVLAARARACRLPDEDPRGGRGPHRRCPAQTSTTVPARLYLPRVEPGYLQFSSSATTACAADTVANLKLWTVARR